MREKDKGRGGRWVEGKGDKMGIRKEVSERDKGKGHENGVSERVKRKGEWNWLKEWGKRKRGEEKG